MRFVESDPRQTNPFSPPSLRVNVLGSWTFSPLFSFPLATSADAGPRSEKPAVLPFSFLFSRPVDSPAPSFSSFFFFSFFSVSKALAKSSVGSPPFPRVRNRRKVRSSPPLSFPPCFAAADKVASAGVRLHIFLPLSLFLPQI